MSGMSFVPLGVGDAFSARFYSSCVAVRAQDKWILVDCPHPIRKMMREASEELDVESVEAVLLTHLHADHCSGLEGLAYFSRFVLGRRMKLVVHPAVASRLWDGCLAAGMEALKSDASGTPTPMRLQDYFDLVPLNESSAVEVGPFRITCRPTRHHIPTTAFRIRAEGRELGCSADTSFDPDLIEWLGAADLILHETNLGIHTPYEELARLPETVRRKMRLIHFPDDFDVDSSSIEALRQGLEYAV